MRYAWDPDKASSNFAKHGVSFAEAATIFLDPLATTYPDPEHSVGERRYVTIGYSATGRIRVVSHAEVEEGLFRIISARTATKRESNAYQES